MCIVRKTIKEVNSPLQNISPSLPTFAACVSPELSQMCHEACPHQRKWLMANAGGSVGPGVLKMGAGWLPLCWLNLASVWASLGRDKTAGRAEQGGGPFLWVGQPGKGGSPDLAVKRDANPCPQAMWS